MVLWAWVSKDGKGQWGQAFVRLARGMLRGVVLAVVARRRRRVRVVVLALVVLSSGAVLHWAEVGSRGGWIRTGCWRTRSYNKKRNPEK